MMRIMLLSSKNGELTTKKYQKLSNKMLDLQNKHVGLYLAELWTHFVNYGGKKLRISQGWSTSMGCMGY